jgi:hypothetical protein
MLIPINGPRVALLLIVAATTLAGCQRSVSSPAPERVQTPVQLPKRSSTIVVPVSASLADLERGLNARIPVELWSIDQPDVVCAEPQKIRLFKKDVKVTPTIRCRIVGRVRRGPIRLGGQGDRLTIRMPVRATISARDIGGVIARETATGSAEVRATARISMTRDWSPTAKVDIDYDWTEPPGIDFLGQRILFVQKADAKLRKVVADLERSLPAELASLKTRDHLARFWRRGFTSVMLNRDRPPVWMRITPQRLGFGGYRIADGQLQLRLAADAITETFVGDRPADPVPTPLPPPTPQVDKEGLRFFVPVLADYRQLEPVLQRALKKLAAKGIVLTGVGPVDAQFGKVTIYATHNGRLAVGVQARVTARKALSGKTEGTVWLSAIPYNTPGSQVVRIRDLQVAGQTDSSAVNLLIELFENNAVQGEIVTALTHDFGGDYARVLTAARKAISGRREGDFILDAQVTDVVNGAIQVTGQGLFLPVRADGTARIVYRPLPRR